MSAAEPLPARSGPDEPGPPEGGHRADVAATAAGIRRIVGVLRELDLGQTPPAASATDGWDESSGGGEADAPL